MADSLVKCYDMAFPMKGLQAAPTQTGAEGSPSPAEPVSPGMATPAPIRAPVIPDYDLLRRIGGGAYGEVWLARSKATGVFRAVKIVWRHTFQDRRPFQREFDGIQNFEEVSRTHPSQLSLFHIGRNDAQGYFYYVMELADGLEDPKAETRTPKEGHPGLRNSAAESGSPRAEDTPAPTPARASEFGLPSALGTRPSDSYVPHTLRADLANGRLPVPRVLEIGLALAEALAHLHRHGLVHRDVKPSNVIFVNGRPKLADIGLVTDASDQCSIVGTEGYLPPEGPGTPQADIFALGKVLYEAATGLDRREYPRIPPGVREWTEGKAIFELNEIILRACATEAARRYSSADAMQADLRLLQHGCSLKGRHTWQNRMRILRNAGLAITGLVLIAAGCIFFWQKVGPAASRPLRSSNNENATDGTSNGRAAEAYVLGLPGLRRGTSEGYRQALVNFTAATDADPDFVAAWARLFEIQLMSEDHDIYFIDGKARKLKEFAAKLANLAPTNAETHAALAIVAFLNEWRWVDAEREFRQALAADPNCRMALTYYGYFLTRLRRSGEARTMLQRALKQDPTSPLVTKLLGHCEWVERHYDKALQFYQSAEELEPSYPGGHYWSGRVYLAQTNYPQALDEFEKYELRQGLHGAEVTWRYKGLREALQKEGPRGYWTKRLEDRDSESWSQDPYGCAQRYARLGDKPMALNWLEKAFAQRDSMENLLVDEFWDDFHQEPRFKAIVKQVGLERWAH